MSQPMHRYPFIPPNPALPRIEPKPRILTGLRLRLALKHRPPHVKEALYRVGFGNPNFDESTITELTVY